MRSVCNAHPGNRQLSEKPIVTFRLVAFQYTTKRCSNHAIYLRMADCSRMASITIWMLIVLTAFAFAAAGVLKLVGDPMFSDSFGKMGLPGAFGYFIGCCEIAGAGGPKILEQGAPNLRSLDFRFQSPIGQKIQRSPEFVRNMLNQNPVPKNHEMSVDKKS